MLHTAIKALLDNIDAECEKPFSSLAEEEISIKTNSILKDNNNYQPSKEDEAENLAFGFQENYQPYDDNDFGWGSYYRPRVIVPNEQGQVAISPHISHIDAEILDYWTERAQKAKHPVLSSRYADLVVDFSSKIDGRKVNLELLHKVIDSNILICEKQILIPMYCHTKIKRALALAILINNSDKIEQVKKAIIKYERDTAIDDKPGLWGHAFKWLVLDPNFAPKITLCKQEKEDLVQELEDKLVRIDDNFLLVKRAALLLSKYYAEKKDESNLLRVLKAFESTMKRRHDRSTDVLLRVSDCQTLLTVYQNYGKFPSVQSARKQIMEELSQIDLDFRKSLQLHEYKVEIEPETIDNIQREFFGVNSSNDLELVVARMAIVFMPKHESIENLIKTMNDGLLSDLIFAKKIISDDGIPIATLKSLQDDYESNYTYYTRMDIQFYSGLLSFIIHKLKEQYSTQQIIEYFSNSILFKDDNKGQRPYLERALTAYWDNDYLVSSHLFCPLIECAIRELVKICHGRILCSNKYGGFRHIILSSLLEQYKPLIDGCFSGVDQSMAFYLRFVLTDEIGMNLRNDFAHGIGKWKFFSQQASDRLFHVMTCLSLVSTNEQTS